MKEDETTTEEEEEDRDLKRSVWKRKQIICLWKGKQNLIINIFDVFRTKRPATNEEEEEIADLLQHRTEEEDRDLERSVWKKNKWSDFKKKVKQNLIINIFDVFRTKRPAAKAEEEEIADLLQESQAF